MKIRQTGLLVAFLLLILWVVSPNHMPESMRVAHSAPGRISRMNSQPGTRHSSSNFFRKPRKAGQAGVIKIRPVEPAVPANASQRLGVAWGGRWWPAEIKQTDGERHLIHYTGYGNEWDEWVTGDRMRDLGQEKAVVLWGSQGENINNVISRRWSTTSPGTETEFIRQVSLDLTGALPTAAQTRDFEADTSENKREKWVETLTSNLKVKAGEPLDVETFIIKSLGFADIDQDTVLTGSVLFAVDQDVVASSALDEVQSEISVYISDVGGRIVELPAADPAQPVVRGAPAQGDLLVEWGKQWWPAEILKTEGEKHFIHYVGYGPEWDEWVTTTRMGVYSGENQPAPETP